MPSLPKGRTLDEFRPLMPAETEIFHAVAAGEDAIIGASRPVIPGQDSLVRAEFLRFLALGGDAGAPVHEKGIFVHGAWIAGTLDLTFAEIRVPLMFVNCWFEATPKLLGTKCRGTLSLEGSFVRGLLADGLQCHADMNMRGGFEALGEVRLVRAKIGGNLDCSGGRFENPKGCAIKADGITVSGAVFLRDSFRAQGEVRLLGAKIGGNLECSGGRSKNRNGYAISADGITVNGAVFMRYPFLACGEVSLRSAKIGSNLSCTGGRFENPNGRAMSADGITVAGSVVVRSLLPGQDEVQKRIDFQARGEVRLLGAKIGGDLECSGGQFENPNGDAISADGMTVSGTVHLNNGFQARGEVLLTGAKIGTLECSGGQFEKPKGYAITAESMNVSGTFFFRNVNITCGTINLAFAHVARLVDDLRSWPHGIVLDGFVYDTFRSPPQLQASGSPQQPQASGSPQQPQANATSAPTQAKERLKWLDKQSPEHSGTARNPREFRPQPWQQLRKVLHDDGHYEDARRVAIAFENRKRFCGLIGEISPRAKSNFIVSVFDWLRSRTAPIFHALYGGFIGYGYRPLRLLGIVVAFWFLSTGVFCLAAQNNLFVPSDPAHIGLLEKPAFDACNPDKTPSGNWTSCTSLPPNYPGFHSLVYALDVMLPITKLGQEDHWTLIDPRKAKTTFARDLAWFTRIWAWIGTLFSWGVGAMILATFTNLLKRQDE